VTQHSCEVRPEEWIDPWDICAPEAKVDPFGTRFECRGRVVESGCADAKHANTLSLKMTEVYVIG
jgi:hypothetical protein